LFFFAYPSPFAVIDFLAPKFRQLLVMADKSPTKSAADERSYILEGHTGNQQVNTKYSKYNDF